MIALIKRIKLKVFSTLPASIEIWFVDKASQSEKKVDLQKNVATDTINSNNTESMK